MRRPATNRAADWQGLLAELEETLRSEQRERRETVSIRTKEDEVWRNACDAAAKVAGDADWSAPIARRATDDIAAFVRELLGARDEAPVTVTTGGTESNYLALKTARDRAFASRSDLREPTVVLPRSAHPCLSKAAHDLGVRELRVALGADRRADVAALERAITEHTIMVVASLPSDSHGLCDPVPAIASLASARGVWCHVDACLGGFLVPYLKRLGHALPDFDFRVPGVCSISLDAHKYGYAPTGSSTLVLREAGDLRHQRYAFDAWDGPAKTYDYFAGTRPIDHLIACWATLRQLGHPGYLERARRVRSNTEALFEALRALPGLSLLNEPEAGAVHFSVADVPLADLAADLRAFGHDRFNVTTDPPGLIVFVGPHCDERLRAVYVRDLEALLAARR